MRNHYSLILFTLALLSGVISADYINCTSSTKTTHLDNGKVNTIIESYPAYITQDGNACTHVTKARSLLNTDYYIDYLEQDKDFTLKATDFNLTSITLDLDSKLAAIIPIRIWELNDTKSKDLYEANATAKVIATLSVQERNRLNTTTLNLMVSNYYASITYKNLSDLKVNAVQDFRLSSKASRSYPFGLGKILEFGYNSTTIMIQTATSGNLKDAGAYSGQVNYNYGTTNPIQVLNYTTNRRELIISFNYSDKIPSGQIINNSKLCFNMSANDLDAGEWAKVGAYLVYSNWTTSKLDFYVASSGNPYGLTANSSYWWILRDSTDTIFKFNRTTGAYISSTSITATATDPRGIDTIGNYLYVADYGTSNVYEYFGKNSTYTGFTFDTAAAGAANIMGIANNGSSFFITDTTDNDIYQFLLDGTFISNFDVAAAGNTNPRGLTYNGSSLLTSDYQDDVLYVWDTMGTAQGNMNYTTSAANSIASNIYGIYSDGSNYYLADNPKAEIYNFSIDMKLQQMHPMQWLEGTANGVANTVVGAYTFNKEPTIAWRNSVPDSTMNFSTSAINGTYRLYCWDTTSGATYGYANDYKNLTYYLRSYWSNANELTDSISLYSKTVAITTSRPFLNVTYDAASSPFVPVFFLNVTSPLNNTAYMCETNILLNVTPYGNATGYDIEYSYDHGVNNISLGSTANGTWIADFLGDDFSTGLHNITLYGYNGSVINTSYVNFSIGWCPSALGFTVLTLGGGSNTTNSSETANGNWTEAFYFNSSSMHSQLVRPCANPDGTTNCQSGMAKPIYSILNTGLDHFDFFMKLTTSLSGTGIRLCANSSGAEVGGGLVSVCSFSGEGNLNATSWIRLANELDRGAYLNVTLYANFSGVLGGVYSRVNVLNSTTSP